MSPELKQQWTAALRSGQYEQGHIYLRTEDNRFCCLGVLRMVAGLEWGRIACGAYQQGWSALACSLDESSKKFVGLTQDQINTLVGMNDGWRNTFAEIADWIDANL